MDRYRTQVMMRLSAGVLWIVVLTSGTIAFGQQGSAPQSPAAIDHDAPIKIPLTVFIGSLGATAGITWQIAKYDSRRARKIDQMSNEIAMLKQRITPSKCTKSSHGDSTCS